METKNKALFIMLMKMCAYTMMLEAVKQGEFFVPYKTLFNEDGELMIR